MGLRTGRAIRRDGRLALRASPESLVVEKGTARQLLETKHALCRPGGYGGVAAPVPIPNTAVKRPSADGTSP